MSTYSGEVKGFQVITTLGGDNVLHPVLANDLNKIMNNLYKLFNVETLIELKSIFADHSSNQGHPHSEDPSFGLDMLKQLYTNWLALGNINTFEYFVNIVFNGITIADTDELIYGDNTTYALTVADFFKLLYKYHFGPIYAHPPILNEMFIGQPVSRIPIISFKDQAEQAVYKYPNSDLGTSIDLRCGTFVVDINPGTTQITEYFFEGFADETDLIWDGYTTLPTAGNIVSGEPVLSILRYKTALAKIIFRMVNNGQIDHIAIPISLSYTRVVIAFDLDTFLYGYKNSDGEMVFVTAPRNALPLNIIMAYRASAVNDLRYYPIRFNIEQLSFLLS